MDDIRIYDFDFNLLRVLPARGVECGYISINATLQLCDNGSVEIVFVDDALKEIVENSPDNLIVKWGDIQGFITGYISEGKQMRLVGMTLNGLLHRVVVPTLTEIAACPEEVLRSQIATQAEWLTLGTLAGIDETKTLSTDTYKCADDFAKELLSPVYCGYRIYADFTEKKWYFECIKGSELELIVSADNLNAYDLKTTYTNKEMVFGGWYKQQQTEGDPIWTYISTDSDNSGIYRIDSVLTSTTETEAQKELAKKRAEFEITAKTRNLVYGVDYKLGDVVRIQDNNTAKRKQVTGINIWQEGLEHGEQPIMTDYEEGF